jgi:hypothetical protein
MKRNRIFKSMVLIGLCALALASSGCDTLKNPTAPGGVLSDIKYQKGTVGNERTFPLKFIKVNDRIWCDVAIGDRMIWPDEFFGGTTLTYEAASYDSTYHVKGTLTIDGVEDDSPGVYEGLPSDWSIIAGVGTHK